MAFLEDKFNMKIFYLTKKSIPEEEESTQYTKNVAYFRNLD